MNDTHTPTDGFEQRLRHDLRVLADTVTGAPVTQRLDARKPRRKRLVALAVGVVVAVPAVAAAAVLNNGSEYVDTIAPNRIVMEGSVDGSRYLLIESDRTDQCGNPITGVELVEERENLFGDEWHTTGYEYGEMVTDTQCEHVNDTTRFLKDPALFTDSGAQVGDSFVWVYAVHPDVTTVRITSGDYTNDLTVYEVDGAGYAPFEIPAYLNEYTSELLINGQVVPGSAEVQRVPQP